MTDDIKALAEDQIRKWKMVEELIGDPNFAHLFTAKATSSAVSGEADPTHLEHRKVRVIPARNVETFRPTARMTIAVHSTLPKLAHEFTTGDVLKELQAIPDFKPGAKNVNIAINDSLGILRKRGLVQPTKRKNGFQKVWRKTQQGSAAESRTA